MKTNFDHITDDEINAVCVDPSQCYVDIPIHEHLSRIAHLAHWMGYWQSWLGPPITWYEPVGLQFDGHHRCRATKFLARRKKIQLQMPVRYDSAMAEEVDP